MQANLSLINIVRPPTRLFFAYFKLQTMGLPLPLFVDSRHVEKMTFSKPAGFAFRPIHQTLYDERALDRQQSFAADCTVSLLRLPIMRPFFDEVPSPVLLEENARFGSHNRRPIVSF